MTDEPFSEAAFKKHILWTNADTTVVSSVAEFAYHARHVLLPQFQGSKEERLFLEKCIEELEPTVNALLNSLTYLKGKKRHYYNDAFQNIHGLLISYMQIGIQHAFTKGVEVAALKPIKEQLSRGGKKSAEVRQKASVDPWQKQFDPILIRLSIQRPALSNAALIREAVDEYGKRAPAIPSPRQLSTHLNTLIVARTIAPAPRGAKRGKKSEVS